LEHLSKDQIEAVLTQAFGCRERDGLMILTAWYHGLRASELVGIIRDDIPDGYLRVKRLKGSLLTVQALFENPNPLFDERRRLEHFISGMAGNQRVFPVTRRHVPSHRSASTQGSRHPAAPRAPAHPKALDRDANHTNSGD
jgi:integrase